MRYNEKNSIHIGDRNIVCEIFDTDSIFEVSVIVISNLQGKVVSNYDLIVFGDIEAESLSVMGNFICFGDCEVDAMNVQGRCIVFGSLTVKDGLLSDSLTAKDIDCEVLSVHGSIQSETVNCDSFLSCNGKVIISDGIMGNGKLECDLVVCGEYSSVDASDTVIVLSDLADQLMSLKNNSAQDTVEKKQLENTVSNEVLMDWEGCRDILEKLAEQKNEYSIERDNYLKLFYWSELSKLCDLKQFIELLNLLCQEGNIFRNSDLYAVVKKDLYDKSYSYIYDLSLPQISQQEFSELLYLVTNNQSHLDSTIYQYLLEKIYAKIGLKYSTVSLMLED